MLIIIIIILHIQKPVLPKESKTGQKLNHRKEEVLEPGEDPGHLRANVFQEVGNDKNPKTAQIQGPMTRSKTKQSMDTLQQMVADILSKAQVEKVV